MYFTANPILIFKDNVSIQKHEKQLVNINIKRLLIKTNTRQNGKIVAKFTLAWPYTRTGHELRHELRQKEQQRYVL